MYTLYHSRKEKVLQVKKAKRALRNLEFTEEVTEHNDCYYICLKRAPLVAKAREIRQKWISDLEEELSVLNWMDIK